MAFTILTGGSYTSTGASQRIPLPSAADYFKVTNITQMATNGTTCVAGEWFGSKFGAGASAANDGLRWRKAGSHAILIDTFATSTATNGFTYVTVSPFVESANISGLTMTAANPAVATQTNTYSAGDFVRLYNTTGDLTLGGMVLEISSVSGAGYTFLGLPATAANGYTALTTGFTRRISQNEAVDPQMMYITNISAASVLAVPLAGAVVSTSVDPSRYYAVGMKVHFSVPSSFGMSQINQLTGTITALNRAATTNTAAYNVVVDIDITGFTAFVAPASAGSPTAALFATFSPAGAKTSQNQTTGVYSGYDFNFQPFRTGLFTPYLLIGGGAGSAGGAANDVIDWVAYKFEN